MRALSRLLLAAAALCSQAATAATYCISNVSGLNASVTAANDAAEGTTHELRLRPGTYAVPAGIDFDPAGNKDSKVFSLTGGWNSDCSARTINASATVLNGAASGNDGSFLFSGNNTYTIEGIRFINYSSFSVFDPSCDFDCPDTAYIRVRYNEFRNGSNWGISTEDAGQLIVSNNLIAGLPGGGFGGVAKIYYYNAESPPVVAFNTFASIACGGNNDGALELHSEIAGGKVHHNILQSSCASDLHLSPLGQTWILRSNHYQARSGSNPSASSGNVISSDPGFVDAAGGNFKLRETAPQSNAINAGMTPFQAANFGIAGTIPSQDLDGPAGLRQIGTRYDIGAYESAINDASVLTVTKTADTADGVCNSDCSLREAITAANGAAGLQRIEFAIPGGCPQIIQLGSPLPDIVDDVEIDAYTQPGASANTRETGSDAELCVVLVSQSGTLAQALQVPQAAPASTQATIRGFAFGAGFGTLTVAIRLRGGSGHLIQGNAFGGIGPGSIGPLGELGFGLQIRGSAQNVLVGGTDPEHRNSFGGMGTTAIVLDDATSNGHRIENNYIGLSASGTSAAPIGLNGIFASDSADVDIVDNVIAAVPNSAAISIQGASATGYSIARNRLGMTPFSVATAPFRNGVGVQFASGTGNHLVGSVLGLAPSNTIVNSADAGVWITQSAGNGILVRPNTIHSNGQDGLGLGVDIGPLGQSTNDTGDGDGGPNRGQNWPVVTASLPNPDGTRQVTVELDSNPNTTYRIDVYRSPSCPAGNRGGDMVTRIGSITTTTNAQGNTSASFALSGGGAPAILVAQATNLATNDSSEPGLCFIEPIATSTIITNDTPDPSAFGQPYTVSVLVNAVSGSPSGTVTVSDGSGNQCSDSSIVGGIASCQLLSTSLGNKTLTASYSGSVLHAPSSDTETHTVVQASTTTTITGDAPDPSEAGQAYTVNVQVRTPAGNLAVPNGSVTISDGDAQVCAPIVLDAQGNGTCQATSLIPGNKTLTANYAGNANLGGSNDTEPHVVTSAATTTTITSDNPDPSAVGQPYTVAVSVSSQPGAGPVTGSVAVSDGSGASCNIAALANGSGSCQLTSTSAGNKTLTASYTPNSASFTASNDTEPHSVVLAPTTTTITSDAPDPSLVGQAYIVMVSVTSNFGTPGGTVAINDGTGASCNAILANGSGSCQLTSTIGGNKTLTATYQGSASHASSSDTEAHTVSPIATTTTITSDAPDPSVAGQPYTVIVSVDAVTGGVFGDVQIADGSGATCLANVLLGSGSCQLVSTSAGNKTLTANYLGNASFLASSDTEAHTVSPAQAAATVTTITADTPEPTVPGQPYTVSVTVSSPSGTPTGSVNVNDGAGAGSGNCQITLVNGSGSCQLVSNFAGDRLLTACFVATPAFSGSCDNEVHQTIKADTDLSFNGFVPNPPVEDAPTQVSIALAVTAPGSGTPTGTVMVSASANESCLINLPATSCPLTLSSPGMRTITLSYSGDGNFNPSNRQTQVNVLPDALLANGFE